MYRFSDTVGLASALYADSLECPCAPRLAGDSRLRYLLVRAYQRHWLHPINGTLSSSLTLDVPTSLSPSPINAIETTDHLTMIHASRRGRDFVTAAFDPVVTNHANAARLRRTESPVLLVLLLIELLAHRTITEPTLFRTRRNRSKESLEIPNGRTETESHSARFGHFALHTHGQPESARAKAESARIVTL